MRAALGDAPDGSDAAGGARARQNAFDVIVVGAGMGGATLGKRLTDAGLRVLFLEKGRSAVHFADEHAALENPADRLDKGLWPDRMRLSIDGGDQKIFMPLGCGPGGSTIHYAAALERYERTDVEPADRVPHPTGGWPVPWSVWTRYYVEAERLYGVSGGDVAPGSAESHLAPPDPLGAADRSLLRRLKALGLNPYPLHLARDARASCTRCTTSSAGCRGRGCAAAIALDPAIATGRATLLADSEVVRVEADDRKVTAVLYRKSGVLHRVNAPCVVLAAGACHTPALLLRSRSALWPDGVANGSRLVGRNLMFHANEWFAIWPPRRSKEQPGKSIGLRDFYVVDGMRLGGIQSTGFAASFGNVYGFLRQLLERGRFGQSRIALSLVKLAAYLGTMIAGRAITFVMLIEDFGHDANRVTLDPGDPQRVKIAYQIPEELRLRCRQARHLIRRRLKGLRVMPLHLDVQLNLGHPCGTCRFGLDPASSVLDPDCRSHELDNLYVADASFMPSSGGTNPSLTIAANALRVADIIAERFRVARMDRGGAELGCPA